MLYTLLFAMPIANYDIRSCILVHTFHSSIIRDSTGMCYFYIYDTEPLTICVKALDSLLQVLLANIKYCASIHNLMAKLCNRLHVSCTCSRLHVQIV